MTEYTYPTLTVEKRARAILAEVGHDPLYLTLLADLTTLSDRCRFAADAGGSLVARYLDLPFAAISFFGSGTSLRNALRRLLAQDEPCYALVGESQQAQLESVVHVQHVDPEWQMVYRGDASSLDRGQAVPLTKQDLPAMSLLARRSEMMAFEERAIEKGPCFGVWRDRRLVSMAGTHLKLERMAEIGNVTTDPAYQRRGLATMVVGSTVQALQAEGLLIALQVFKSNVGAVSFYEKLGFEVSRAMYLVRFLV